MTVIVYESCLNVSTVITSEDLKKHGNIWVCPISDHVCTRFLFVWVYEEAAVILPVWGEISTISTTLRFFFLLGTRTAR